MSRHRNVRNLIADEDYDDYYDDDYYDDYDDDYGYCQPKKQQQQQQKKQQQQQPKSNQKKKQPTATAKVGPNTKNSVPQATKSAANPLSSGLSLAKPNKEWASPSASKAATPAATNSSSKQQSVPTPTTTTAATVDPQSQAISVPSILANQVANPEGNQLSVVVIGHVDAGELINGINDTTCCTSF